MLLSDILNWDFMPDDPQLNPGIDMPYVVALPTYAATAWYFDKSPNRPADLPSFLAQVEQFATGDYSAALLKGNDAARRRAAAHRAAAIGLHRPVPRLSAQDQPPHRVWRVPEGADGERGLTTGTLDTRFLGETLDPLSKVASYDPQSAAISAAYVAAWQATPATG